MIAVRRLEDLVHWPSRRKYDNRGDAVLKAQA